jgi:GntR family transcriptional repressor for pyruvate dehydrogenase complex
MQGVAPRDFVPHATVAKLQQLILSGGIQPGERLPAQRQLSEQLGISRPSLREAISVLETIGLVRVEMGRGVFVNAPEARQPKWRHAARGTPTDVYELRYCLEGQAAGLAAQRIDAAGLAELDRSQAMMDEALRQGDVVSMAAADRLFHDTIFRACANPLLQASYQSIHEIVLETQRLPMAHREMLEQTPQEHAEILVALRGHAPRAAARAMQAHILSTARRAGIPVVVFDRD